MPCSVACLYSSSKIAGDRLLTRSGPSSASASSLILRSAATTLSSPVSVRRMLAMATGVPSLSVPVIAARAPWICGALRTESICAWVTDSKSSAWSAAATRDEGATTALAGASSPLTAGSATTASTRASIWERPPGVSASPRKRSVATLKSPESPKSSSISLTASATAWPGGRNATSAPSVGGARRVAPAPSTTVTTRRTAIVTYGRAVTSRLNQPSMLLFMRHLAPNRAGRDRTGRSRLERA